MPKLYADFGSEVEFDMVPFMYGSVDKPSCFDERSPCLEEQTAYCMIDVAQNMDPDSAQDKIVQWQICHSQGTSLEQCHAQVGIDKADVDECLSDTSRMHAIMQSYLDRTSHVHCTPWEEVNGTPVGDCQGNDPTYASVKAALCAADSTLSACASVLV